MNYIFWAIPDQLAGRPGPDLVEWNPSQLYKEGIRSIITVNDGFGVDPVSLAQAGLVHKHFEFPTGEPPNAHQFDVGLDVVPEAYEWYRTAPKPVMVHCSAGKDRTGLFIAYALSQENGLSVEEAMRATRKVRPIAFSAYGWEEFVHDLLIRLNMPST